MLVRRVARPVAAGGDHLDGDQVAGLEDVGGPEVADLPAAWPAPRSSTGTSTAGTVRNGSATAVRAPVSASRQPAVEVSDDVAADRQVGDVGRAREDVRAPGELDRGAAALDGDAAGSGQRDDDHLLVAGVEGVGRARDEGQGAQAGAGSSRRRGGDLEVVAVAGGGAGAHVQVGVHGGAHAALTCGRTSADGGVDRGGDVVVGRVEQRAADDEPAHAGQRQGVAARTRRSPRAWLSGSPPSSSVGSVVASMTRSMSSTTGSFIQV